MWGKPLLHRFFSLYIFFRGGLSGAACPYHLLCFFQTAFQGFLYRRLRSGIHLFEIQFIDEITDAESVYICVFFPTVLHNAERIFKIQEIAYFLRTKFMYRFEVDVHLCNALESVYISYEGMSVFVSRLHQFLRFCLQAGIQALHKQTFRVKLHRRDRGRNPDRG